MSPNVDLSTPPDTMQPIGPYSHVARAGPFITIGGTAGVDPRTGELAGPDIASQTRQILGMFETMLSSAGSDMDHIIHINVFLIDMNDFAAMGECRPARTAIAVAGLPKPGARITMNLTAVSNDA